MSPKPIRTNKDLIKSLFRGAVATVPTANPDHPMGAFLNHVKDSTLEDLSEEDEETEPSKGDVIDVVGESAS